MNEVLLEVRGLKKYFPIFSGVLRKKIGSVKAVDGVDLTIKKGETLGLVGESGCGKTTIGRCLLRLIEPTEGEIYFNFPTKRGELQLKGHKDSPYNLLSAKPNEIRAMRRRMQIVFQDPMSSLNPHMLVKDIVGEPLVINQVAKGVSLLNMVTELLEKVGLAKTHLFRYPHELSGGQRQRVCIARALALNPDFVVLDEPTSNLDVSVQAQILNLLKKLQRESNLTYLFISHDFSVIKHMADDIAVMYLGKIVEVSDCETIFQSPLHPYTKALLSAIPTADPNVKKKPIYLEGEVPSPSNLPPGCRFHSRCSYAMEICSKEEPQLSEVKPGHLVACHLEHYHENTGRDKTVRRENYVT
jgi:oligopeptide/dipeptide ABC transporter ATP-binding protein